MDWIEHCPLRSEDSPEYRLLLATIREEIAGAMDKASTDNRALNYSRINMILILLTIAATAVGKWH